jgi:hypothetical protein
MTDDASTIWDILNPTSLTIPTDVDFDAVILEPPVHPVEVVNE